ncbi:hypothetical protein Bca4012_077313 [Brassica carinata]
MPMLINYASPLPTLDHVQVSSHLENKTLQILKCQTQKNRDTPKDSGMLGKEGSKVDPVNEDLLGNMDEYDDLQFDCSSQESGETDNTDDGQPIALEPEKDNQSDRVSFLAAMFKKTFSEVKTKVKPVKAKEDDYVDEGDPTYTCVHCGAIMWNNERINKSKYRKKPIFTLCWTDSLSKHFQRNTRPYNMVFSFTSLGGKVENSLNKGRGPQMFQLHGENYHLSGSLTPPEGDYAKFGQLYIVDTSTENEVENRFNALSKSKKSSSDTRERFLENPEKTFHMRIVSRSDKDGRTYNMPTASEVAALIPGDFELGMDKRDIVLQHKSGRLTRIDEIHISYLALQYPLIFVYGEDGFRFGIKKGVTEASKKLKKDTISMTQYFAYRIQERESESHVLLYSRRLFQQFIVDAYTTIESNRLRYLKLNQTCLRSDSYDSIKESENDGNSDMNEQDILVFLTFSSHLHAIQNGLKLQDLFRALVRACGSGNIGPTLLDKKMASLLLWYIFI